jgi:hypothetical protein
MQRFILRMVEMTIDMEASTRLKVIKEKGIGID